MFCFFLVFQHTMAKCKCFCIFGKTQSDSNIMKKMWATKFFVDTFFHNFNQRHSSSSSCDVLLNHCFQFCFIQPTTIYKSPAEIVQVQNEFGLNGNKKWNNSYFVRSYLFAYILCSILYFRFPFLRHNQKKGNNAHTFSIKTFYLAIDFSLQVWSNWQSSIHNTKRQKNVSSFNLIIFVRSFIFICHNKQIQTVMPGCKTNQKKILLSKWFLWNNVNEQSNVWTLFSNSSVKEPSSTNRFFFVGSWSSRSWFRFATKSMFHIHYFWHKNHLSIFFHLRAFQLAVFEWTHHFF